MFTCYPKNDLNWELVCNRIEKVKQPFMELSNWSVFCDRCMENVIDLFYTKTNTIAECLGHGKRQKTSQDLSLTFACVL